jgi:Zn-dependent protease with chaperone function
MGAGAGLPRREGDRLAEVIGLAWQFGFPLVFALVVLFYGLWFAGQLVGQQQAAVAALQRIDLREQQQAVELARVNERLERLERAQGIPMTAPAPTPTVPATPLMP